MPQLLALSIGTALLCGIWTQLADQFGLLVWGGFAGCTAFFAAGGKEAGIRTALFTTLSGVMWAMVIIWLPGYFDFLSVSVAVGLITFCMCIQSKLAPLAFIPGTFLGCFSTFAVDGNYTAIVPALILGIGLGFLCERSGGVLKLIEYSQVISKDLPDRER